MCLVRSPTVIRATKQDLTSVIKVLALTIVALLVWVTPATAQTVYKWVDESGLTHYGEQPPAGVKAEKVGSYRRTSPSPGSSASPSNTDSVAAPAQPEQAASPKPQLTPEQAKRKQERCAEEKQRLASLQSKGRVRMALPDGGFKFLSEEEIAAEVETTKAVIEDSCN